MGNRRMGRRPRAERLGKHRRVDLGGSVAAHIAGAPSRFADLYHAAMGMGWPSFIGSACLCFLVINLVFGSIYALLPASIADADRVSLMDGIFFSIETLSTVGYGHAYPRTTAAHVVASAEILVGVFFSATINGLVFARFSLPKVGIAFSRHAVIGTYEGQLALMVRMASLHARPLADADAQVAWLDTTHALRRLVPLDLVHSTNPIFGLSWTLVHLIPEGSAFLAALEGDGRFYISVFVRGTDMLLFNQAAGTRTYQRGEILRNREFVEILTHEGEDLLIDLRKLDETRPVADESRLPA